MTRRRAALIPLLAAALLMAGGCYAAPTPDPTPTPLFSSEEEAFAAAEATYRAYVDASNQVDLDDPETFEPVFALTTGATHSSDKKALSRYHAQGLEVTGESSIALVEPTAWDPASNSATLSVCLDVSTIDLLDSSGTSHVDPDRVDVQTLSVTLVAESGHFLISLISGRDRGPRC